MDCVPQASSVELSSDFEDCDSDIERDEDLNDDEFLDMYGY